MKKLFFPFLLLFAVIANAQSKVGGLVTDENNDPVAFANILFKDSYEGTITDDNGNFYLESDNTYDTLVVSFIGYEDLKIPLTQKVNYNMKIQLKESSEQLKEVVVFAGKQSKKNNPAVEILKKIWAKKRQNGVRQFKQYAFDKYEKVEFDLNTIDSADEKEDFQGARICISRFRYFPNYRKDLPAHFFERNLFKGVWR